MESHSKMIKPIHGTKLKVIKLDHLRIITFQLEFIYLGMELITSHLFNLLLDSLFWTNRKSHFIGQMQHISLLVLITLDIYLVQHIIWCENQSDRLMVWRFKKLCLKQYLLIINLLFSSRKQFYRLHLKFFFFSDGLLY